VRIARSCSAGQTTANSGSAIERLYRAITRSGSAFGDAGTTAAAVLRRWPGRFVRLCIGTYIASVSRDVVGPPRSA